MAIGRILVTGGAGFIGSALVRQLIAQTQAEVCNVDKLTYAGNLASLAEALDSPRHHFHRADICDRAAMDAILRAFKPQAIMHLAAESHVDRSIDGPGDFIQTNVVGTFTLLEAATAYWRGLDQSEQARFRFHHVSTDEVFGSLGAEGSFNETTAYDPRSPYSATKAASDHLVRAWHHTHGLPVVLTNCSNNYGPYHFPEKLIPLTILKAISGESLPVYGDGSNVRDWLHVDDHARALRLVVERGTIGETYCVGGNAERTNLQVVEAICDVLDRLQPRADGASWLDGVAAIINCAAYTAVDQAECEPGLAMQVNARAPTALAAAAAQAGIPIVHVSTDYVFPAHGTGPWREHDRPAPCNVYGESKLAGEEAVRASGARHAIVRTAWVVSAEGANFVKTMLRLGQEREVLRIVADQRGCPTHAGDLAAALAAIAQRLTHGPDQPSGTWHCTNAGETTWHGLATHVFAEAERLGLKVPEVIEPIQTADYPTRAVRPLDSRLDCSLAAREFGIALRPWDEAVSEIIGELVSEGIAAWNDLP